MIILTEACITLHVPRIQNHGSVFPSKTKYSEPQYYWEAALNKYKNEQMVQNATQLSGGELKP